MTLIQKNQAIAYIRRNWNLFILDLVIANKVMQVQQTKNTQANTSNNSNKAIVIRSQGQLTHLVSKNKQVKIWLHRLGYASNTKVIWASKFFIRMRDFSAKYNLIKVYSNLEYSKFDLKIKNQPKAIYKNNLTSNNLVQIATKDNFNSICLPCIATKQICRTDYNKMMTKIDKKLDKIHVNLWGPHYSTLLLEKTYAAILLDTKTQKTWIFYLCSKNKFVNLFQTWLLKVEKESGRSLKVLHTDGGEEFILAKLKGICNQKSITIKYVIFYMHKENGLAKQA